MLFFGNGGSGRLTRCELVSSRRLLVEELTFPVPIACVAPTKPFNSVRFEPTKSPRWRFPRTKRPLDWIPPPGLLPTLSPFGPIGPEFADAFVKEPEPARAEGEVCWIFPGAFPTVRFPINCAWDCCELTEVPPRNAVTSTSKVRSRFVVILMGKALFLSRAWFNSSLCARVVRGGLLDTCRCGIGFRGGVCCRGLDDFTDRFPELDPMF